MPDPDFDIGGRGGGRAGSVGAKNKGVGGSPPLDPPL